MPEFDGATEKPLDMAPALHDNSTDVSVRTDVKPLDMVPAPDGSRVLVVNEQPSPDDESR
jgi:hypothetical protein